MQGLTVVNVGGSIEVNTARLGPPRSGGYQKRHPRPSSVALLRRGFAPLGFGYNDIEEY